jgi:hypothetical protein
MAKSPFRFFKGKVGLAIMGACLIGGTSAVLAAKTTPARTIRTVASTDQIANSSNPTSSSGTGTATSTQPTSSPGAGASPTVPAGPRPTSTPRPPTPTPAVGQTIHLDGSIRAINTGGNTFSLHRNGVTTIIDVNSGTNYSGSATSFSSLQINWFAQVTCVVQADRSCQASQVTAFQDT